MLYDNLNDGAVRWHIRLHAKLRSSGLRRYTTQAAQGLFYLHRHGVAHGNLKNSNILVGRASKEKILDGPCSSRLF